MLTLLFLLWLSRACRHLPAGTIKNLCAYMLRVAPFLLAGIGLSLTVAAQEQHRKYGVYRNGKAVGTIQVRIKKEGNKTWLRLESSVRTHLLFPLSFTASEEAVYEHGVLVSSSVRRWCNGTEKENRKLTAAGGYYAVSNKGRTQKLPLYPITYSNLNLYEAEPVNVSHVFSDSNLQLVPIQKMGQQQYRVNFPDGSSNEYFYENGRCTRLKIKNTWFTAVIQLISSH